MGGQKKSEKKTKQLQIRSTRTDQVQAEANTELSTLVTI